MSEYFEDKPVKPTLLVNKRGRAISVPNELEAQKLRAIGFKDPVIKDCKGGDYFPQYDQGQEGEFKDVVAYVGNFNPQRKGDSDILDIIEI